MSYIGSSAAVVPVAFSGVNSQAFNGDGSTVAFTLNRPVSSVKAIEVVVNNVQQSPYDGSYSVSNTTLTFSAAPSSGTANIYVTYLDFPVGSITDPNAVTKTGDTMTGALTVTVAGNTETLNRTGSDGVIQTFQKDGGAVGSFSVYAGDRLEINSSGAAGYISLAGTKKWNWNASTFSPYTDASFDLGEASARVKDLYLSGGVYVGGTGAANHLDDYEEGTWTPTLTASGSWTITSANYVKIGAFVHCNMRLTATSSIPAQDFGGLPFVPESNSAGIVGYQNSVAGEVFSILIEGAGMFNFRVSNTQYGLNNGAVVVASFMYKTTA